MYPIEIEKLIEGSMSLLLANEAEKLIEDNMELVFSKLIILFASCVSVQGIVVSLLHHNCSRNRSC